MPYPAEIERCACGSRDVWERHPRAGVGCVDGGRSGRYGPDRRGTGRVAIAPIGARVREHRRWFGRRPRYWRWSPLYGLEHVAPGRPPAFDPLDPRPVPLAIDARPHPETRDVS